MRKIASPQELRAELQRILTMCQGPERPSRLALARELGILANRIAVQLPSSLERLLRMTVNEGHEVKNHEVLVRFKTERDANKFEDRYNARFDEDDEDDQDQMAYGALDPKTRLYTIHIPL